MTEVNPQLTHQMPAAMRRKVTDIFTRDEIRTLTSRSNFMGFVAVGVTWGTIALSFASMAWAIAFPLAIAIPVFAVAVTAIATRQLALAVLMHEASHGTLFRTRWLNDVFADWVCARPIGHNLKKYRAHHFIHHTSTGQPEDPDLSLVKPFPATRASLARKLLRDLLGPTGIKFIIGRVLMDMCYIRWTVASDVIWLPRNAYSPAARLRLLVWNVAPAFVVNGLIFASLWAVNHPWLFAAWISAYVSPLPLLVRIRSIAEHACTEGGTDPFLNTRTTRAGLIARATVAPINVNYHIEHHVMASVPFFRLPMMHRMLRERRLVAEPPGYLEVLRTISNKA